LLGVFKSVSTLILVAISAKCPTPNKVGVVAKNLFY
jgi:hypothetical protein